MTPRKKLNRYDCVGDDRCRAITYGESLPPLWTSSDEEGTEIILCGDCTRERPGMAMPDPAGVEEDRWRNDCPCCGTLCAPGCWECDIRRALLALANEIADNVRTTIDGDDDAEDRHFHGVRRDNTVNVGRLEHDDGWLYGFAVSVGSNKAWDVGPPTLLNPAARLITIEGPPLAADDDAEADV